MKYFIGILLFSIFLILSFIYIKISSPVVSVKKTEININNSELKTINQIKITKPDFVYNFPVRILYMKIGFNPFKYEIIYKVTLKNTDNYALFNIKTILDNYNVNYSVYNAKKSEIYIFFKNLSQANTVLNLFKEYNFNIKITKIKKRI